MDDGVVSIPDDEGIKRRLPLWMMGVAAADKVRNSEEENSNGDNNLTEGRASQTVLPKSKPTAGTKRIKKGVSLPEQEPSELESCLLTKCKKKKRGRKLNHEADGGGSDGEVHEDAAEMNRCNKGTRKVRKYVNRKRGVADSSRTESSEEIETPSPGEDEGELTVDDLMSIAQEYIKTDKYTEKQRPSHREQEAERQLPAISLSGKESGGLPSAPQNDGRSPPDREMVSVHSSTGTSAGGGTVVNPSRTGDPAQDMLDLFLGPLLKKKPPGEENKIDFVKQDMTFAFEIRTQLQNNIATEEVVSLTKKKSSLKDKVAMFLD